MPDTILIVDDTPANVGVLLQALGGAGHRLLVAEDGEEALARIARSAPDLVLLDVMMPGIDGFETCRRLRALPGCEDLPVIFMTALTETADKLRGFAAGGVDYVTKPLQHDEVLARVSTHLALRRLRRELAAEVELRARFMAAAAHDLRNPLFEILLAADLIRREPGLPAEARTRVEDIREASLHLRRIIDAFLQLPAPGAGPAVCDPSALAADVARQFTPAAERKRIRLALAGPLPPCVVRGDALHLRQAVVNLVSNALKFTPRDGVVTVATRAAAGRVRIEISDTGPGVPEAERALLFTAGARLSPRPTGDEESHGHGLHVVRQLVALHGGETGADFPATGGSVFWCELPAA